MNQKTRLSLPDVQASASLCYLIQIGSFLCPALLCLSIFLSNECYGQGRFEEGFIITTDYDTLSGQLASHSNNKNYRSGLFRQNDKQREYTPEEILGFGYNRGKFFMSGIIPGAFVEVLVKGEFNLYKYKNIFLAQKNGHDLHELKYEKSDINSEGRHIRRDDLKWKSILSYLLSDCLGNVNDELSNTRLTDRSLTQFVVRYHQCRNSEYTEYSADKPWTKAEFGLVLSYSSSKVNNNTPENWYPQLNDSYISFDPLVGLVTAISSPRISERFYFQPEIYYSQIRFYGTKEVPSASFIQYYDTDINLSTISVPISIKYLFSGKKIQFGLQAGVHYDRHIRSKAAVITEVVGNAVVNTYEQNLFEINKNQVGYWTGLGLSKQMSHVKLEASVRYSLMPFFTETARFDRLKMNNEKLSFTLILYKK